MSKKLKCETCGEDFWEFDAHICLSSLERPLQAASASASCSAASASEQGNNGADTSSRSARESDLEAVANQYNPEQDEAIRILLKDVPKEGGHVSRKIFKEIIRMAFRGGVISVLTRPPEALPAAAELALARNSGKGQTDDASL